MRTSRRTSSNPDPIIGDNFSYSTKVIDKTLASKTIERLHKHKYIDSGTDYSPYASFGLAAHERLPGSLTVWDSPTGNPTGLFPKEVAGYAENLIIDGKVAYTIQWYREWKFDPEAKITEQVKEVAFDVVSGFRVTKYTPTKKLTLGHILKGAKPVPIEIDNPITGPYPHGK